MHYAYYWEFVRKISLSTRRQRTVMRPEDQVLEFIDDSFVHSSVIAPSNRRNSPSCSSTTMSQSMTLPNRNYDDSTRVKSRPFAFPGRLNGVERTMSSSSPKLSNRETELNAHDRLNGDLSIKTISSLKSHHPLTMSELLVEPVDDEAPTVGFGIAVSGGRDNPHFRSGDPAIVVSDVVRSGPALGHLQLNDRIVSANGVSLENTAYQAAVQVMKENEQLNLIVKRRVPPPMLEFEQRTLKFTLTKSRRKDDFGIVLGCRFYIKNITNPKLAEKEPGLKEGDTVVRINGQNLDGATLEEAAKLLEYSREKLSLVIHRDVPRGSCWKWGSQNTVYERVGSVLSDAPRDSPRASPRMNGRVNNIGRSPVRRTFDCVNGNPLSGQQRVDLSDLPPRPQPHSLPVVRLVQFRKESGSVGVRVVGGNQVGIFVSAVQSQSPAANKNVRPGDKILKVNGRDMNGITREEAVLYLLGLQDEVQLLLQFRKDEYDRVRAQQLGDNFFIRAHFNYEKPSSQQGLSFKHGDIFQIIDTLFGGTVGSWQAIKVYSPSNGVKTEPTRSQIKGVIPNSQTADKLACSDPLHSSRASFGPFDLPSSGNTLSRALFRRKFSRRTKSLTKGHWDEVEFREGNTKFPAYERVQLSTPVFPRPVVLFGPLSDVARSLLFQQFPSRFSAPSSETAQSVEQGHGQGIVRLSAICEVMSRNKHCLLDVTPSSVEKLQYAQYAPIVILVDVDSKSRLKELRSRSKMMTASGNGNGMMSTRKLMLQTARIRKHYGYLFTATLDATKEDGWFESLRDLISHLQNRRVWMSETKPTDVPSDDFLLPMTSSRFNNCDSDGESLKGDYSSDYCASTRNGTKTLLEISAFDDSPLNESRSRHDSPSRNNPTDPVYVQYTNYSNSYAGADSGPTTKQSLYPVDFGPCAADLYANREAFVSHLATLRRPPRRIECKPRIPVPVITAAANNTTTTTTTTVASVVAKKPSIVERQDEPGLGTRLSDAESADKVKDKEQTFQSGEEIASESNVSLHPRSIHTRHAGYYDVKQILAEQSDLCSNSTSTTATTAVNCTDMLPNSTSRTASVPSGHEKPCSQLTTPCSYDHPTPRSSFILSPRQTPVVNGRPPIPPPNSAIILLNPAHSDPPSSPEYLSDGGQFHRLSTFPPPAYSRLRNQHFEHREDVPPPAPSSSTAKSTLPMLFLNKQQQQQQQQQHLSRLSSKEEDDEDEEGHFNCTISPQINSTIRTCKPQLPYKPAGLGANLERNVNGFPILKEGKSDRKEKEDDNEDEQTIVAHVSGVIDSKGGILKSDETGVSLYIPSGAIPDGVEQQIYFKVCRDSQLAPPLDAAKGETLLSPLVMCGPQGLHFSTPVELRLPHSASGVNCDQWSFALKSAAGVEAEWKQISLSDNDDDQRTGRLDEGFVSVKIDHF